MKRQKEWPDPPARESLPELSITCPVCNDKEHKMTIFMDKAKGKDYSAKSYFIKCNKCGTEFKLIRTEIIERNRER